jgi:hypothetical protein
MRTGRPARQIDIWAVRGLLEGGWSLRRVSRQCGIPLSTLRQRLAAGTLPTNPVTVEQFVEQGLDRAMEEYKRSAAGRQVTASGGDVTQMFLTTLIAILQRAGLTVTVPTSAA